MVLVKNVNGTSRFSAPSGYSSWLAYWEAKTGRKAGYCNASSCWNQAQVGAHVMKVNSYGRHYYIVPLCYSCNARTDEFYVSETDLVPVPSNL